MVTTYKYFKNSNTGDLLMSQEFTSTIIKNMPVNWYRGKEKVGENLKLIGYVEISEKKYNRLSKKL